MRWPDWLGGLRGCVTRSAIVSCLDGAGGGSIVSARECTTLMVSIHLEMRDSGRVMQMQSK